LDEFHHIADQLEGQLTGSIFFNPSSSEEKEIIEDLTETLQYHVGRVIYNGVPTGVEVCNAMHHGGPYPATTAPKSTSVGMTAIRRFLRPVAYQNVPDPYLPDELRDDYSATLRLVNGKYEQ
jgi:NADP-dependent aldehyde dehydrogenase